MNIIRQRQLQENNREYLRSEVYIRDKGICWICADFVLLTDYDLGHIVDACNGGSLKLTNLVVMHHKCNLAKPKHVTLAQAVMWKLNNKQECAEATPLVYSPPPSPPHQPKKAYKQPSTPITLYHPDEFKQLHLTSEYGKTKILPPYVSVKTFKTLLLYLQQGIPKELNHRYLGKFFNGSNIAHLTQTLKYLGFIDTNVRPTERLASLMSATLNHDNENVCLILQSVFNEGYKDIISNCHLEILTIEELNELFYSTYRVFNPDVRRKCVKFFIELAKDADISLPPVMLHNFRTRTPEAIS